MVQNLVKLEAVQELDLQIYGLEKKKAEFPVRMASFEKEVQAWQGKVNDKKKQAEEIEKNYAQQKGALELNEERSKRSQQKLENIKTNQEFQALTKEIEALKKNSSVIQDTANKIRAELDAKNAEMATLQKGLDAALGVLNTEKAKVDSEGGGIDADLSKLLERRKAAIEGIDKRVLASYDRVRGAKGGSGLAIAKGGKCTACNLRIPPQMYNELQRGAEIHECPSCRRLLLHREGAAPTASAQAGL